MLIDPVLASATQSGAAVTVLLGALPKWRRPAMFRQAVAQYQLLPEVLVTPVAFAIVVVETLGAIALLLPDWRTVGAATLVLLLSTFATALAINIVRGHTDIDCGCHGFAAPDAAPQAVTNRIGWLHVARVLAIAALAATAFIAPAARAIVWVDYLTLTFSVLLTVCGLTVFDGLLANTPRLNHLRNS
ncbi:MauE/DoxX family redox-associated membrane protein [Paraburkholderia pallida]|uniref:Methylamine utilization protein MauE n=1 Tax=Paraburkholderia pallida TaxID=2547399 RepID=A0A4P7D3R5_9BURK|nr:MauE/DoxX family redox-associated membrane protein [Paraburkholderia pallida]QBR03299.1 methylamine utilization protein MauE [Paraburkholderia pallida]